MHGIADVLDSEVPGYKYLRRHTRVNTIDDLESADCVFFRLIQLSHVTLSSSHLVLLPTE